MQTNDVAVKSCYYESVRHSKHYDEKAEVCQVTDKGTCVCKSGIHQGEEKRLEEKGFWF